MSTKRSTTQQGNTRTNIMERLETALEDVSDREALAIFQKVFEIKSQKDGERLEPAVFPLLFLDMMRDTVLETLKEQLKTCNAPKEAVDLLEDFSMLDVWMAELRMGEKGMTSRFVNSHLVDTVANASRNVAAVGGGFFSPYGVMRARNVVKA